MRSLALLLVLALAGCGFADEVFSPDCRDIGVTVRGTRIGDTYQRWDYVCGDRTNRNSCSGHDGVLCVVNR